MSNTGFTAAVMAGRFTEAKDAFVTFAKTTLLNNHGEWDDEESEEVQYGRDFDHLVAFGCETS